MCQTSSPVDSRLTKVVAAIEREEAGLRVLSAQVYTVPYADIHAVVEVLADRQFNILEEFILRAAHDLEPRPTLDQLASMLGLDPLFVEASWRKLDAMQAVAVGASGTLGLTDRGREYYEQGQLPPVSLEEELDLRYWFVTDTLVPVGDIPRSPAPDPVLPGFDFEDEDAQMATLAGVITDVQRVISVTEAAGLGLHQPGEGQAIHAVSNWRVFATGVSQVAVLGLLEKLPADGEQGHVSLRAIDPVSGRREFATETVLEAWLTAGRVVLRDFVPPVPEEAVGETVIEASPPVPGLGDKSLERGEGTPEGHAAAIDSVPPSDPVDMRDGARLRARLAQTLEAAQHTVLLGLPQRAAEVFDTTLLDLLADLAERRVVSVIGICAADTPAGSAAPASGALADRVHGRTTSHTTPSAVVIPIGMRHSVDAVIDGQWRAFGPDDARTPAAGADDQGVSEKSAFEACLADALVVHWENAVATVPNFEAGGIPEALTQGLARYCVAWVALGLVDIALLRIIELVDAVPTALPEGFRLLATILVLLQRLPDDLLDGSVDLERIREAVIDLDTRIVDLPEERYADAQAHLTEAWHSLRRRLAGY